MPSTQQALSLYVCYLIKSGLAVSTVKTYLSAISFMHKISYMEDPTASKKLNILCRGASKHKLQQSTAVSRLPITTPILTILIKILQFATTSRYDFTLYKALFITCYFACLRASEVVATKTPEHALTSNDIVFHKDKVVITFRTFKHSKGTHPKYVLQENRGSCLCPVKALRLYGKIRPNVDGQYFVFPAGTPVSRAHLSETLRLCARYANLDHRRFNTHSFRIGRATELHSLGAAENEIMASGRWSSNAFKRYIRPGHFTLNNN